MTLMPIETHQWESPIANSLWLRTWRLGEWLQAPVSPLFETFVLPILAHGRQGTSRKKHLGFKLPRAWRVLEPAYAIINGYFYARANPEMVTVLRQPPEFIIGEILGGWLGQWNSVGLPTYINRLSEYEAIDPRSASNAELLGILESLAKDVAEVWYALGMAAGGLIPLERCLGGLTKGVLSDELEDKLTLLRGFRTKIVEEQQSLYELAQISASSEEISNWLEENPVDALLTHSVADKELGVFREKLLHHLQDFGHQVSSLDFVFPTLAEAPVSIGIALRCYMDTDSVSPQAVVRQTELEREELTRKVFSVLPRPKRSFLKKVLSRCQEYAIAREDIVFHFQKGWPLFRRILLEIGDRFSNQRIVKEPDDIFFVTRQELWRLGLAAASGESLMDPIAERRALWHERHSLVAPTHIPPVDNPAWERAMTFPVNIRDLGKRVENGKRILRGTAASQGQVRGRARVLGFPSEFRRLEAGDILVTVATTPSWTPLFAKIAGVVTDVGAVSSHSSMVAREYKIPAVVGTQHATQTIKDGDSILVDGSAGKVYLN